MLFEHDRRAGKAFDVALLCLILASVLVVLADSLPSGSPASWAGRPLESIARRIDVD